MVPLGVVIVKSELLACVIMLDWLPSLNVLLGEQAYFGESEILGFVGYVEWEEVWVTGVVDVPGLVPPGLGIHPIPIVEHWAYVRGNLSLVKYWF